MLHSGEQIAIAHVTTCRHHRVGPRCAPTSRADSAHRGFAGEECHGSARQILYPWPNRIGDARVVISDRIAQPTSTTPTRPRRSTASCAGAPSRQSVNQNRA